MSTLGGTSVCPVTEDCIELCEEYGLSLKPIARIKISIPLPCVIPHEKVISNWEIMEKLRGFIKPCEFSYLKVIKTTPECLRYEGEIYNSHQLSDVINLLNGRVVKLSGLTESFKIRAVEAKLYFPSQFEWDRYFAGEFQAHENEPGFRPDTVHISGLPCKWFTRVHRDRLERYEHWKNSGSSAPDPMNDWKSIKDPSDPELDVVESVFSSFGPIRAIDIPILDPYSRRKEDSLFEKDSQGGIGTFSTFNSPSSCMTFDVFVQYEDYTGFACLMQTLRNKRIMYTSVDGKSYSAMIKVDFDRTAHMSEKNVLKRKMDALELKALEEERAAKKRKEREEERKLKESKRMMEREKHKAKKKHKDEKKRHHKAQKQKKQRERILKEIEEKKREIEELQKEEALRQDRKLLILMRNREATNLLSQLLPRFEKDKIKEILQKRMRELEEARLEEIQRQKIIVADLEKKRDGVEKDDVLFDRENDIRRRLVKRYRDILDREDSKKRERLRQKMTEEYGSLKTDLSEAMSENLVDTTIDGLDSSLQDSRVSSSKDCQDNLTADFEDLIRRQNVDTRKEKSYRRRRKSYDESDNETQSYQTSRYSRHRSSSSSSDSSQPKRRSFPFRGKRFRGRGHFNKAAFREYRARLQRKRRMTTYEDCRVRLMPKKGQKADLKPASKFSSSSDDELLYGGNFSHQGPAAEGRPSWVTVPPIESGQLGTSSVESYIRQERMSMFEK